MAGWKERLVDTPFATLLCADNSCDVGCKIQLVKKGEDYRLRDCEHKRPVFVEQEEYDFTGMCVCSQELAQSPTTA
jgi:hypothetical protein